MKRVVNLLLFIVVFMTFLSTTAFALNPFINQLLNADPSAHEFEGRMYVYPSHDQDNAAFFDMEDYHVYSSADMKNWIDHGVVLTYLDPDWVMKTYIDDVDNRDNDTFRHPRMWAPDCAYKNSTYYFYYPARDEDNRFRIGVATSKSPSGPFVPVNYNTTFNGESYQGELPIPGSFSMDPGVFIDDDGKAYMFLGGLKNGQLPWEPENLQGCAYWAELDTDPNKPETYMVAFKEPPEPVKGYVDGNQSIGYLEKGAPFYWFEACWIHKRDNKYYLSYSTGDNIPGTLSQIHYAMSDNIAGPWTYMGEVMGEVVGWTNHHSIAKFKDQWYVFYHNSEMSDGAIGKRCICADKLSYDQYGRILQVITTREGAGTSAYSRIKAMFYSGKGNEIFNTELCEGGDIGKCVTGIDDGDYIYFDNVDFGINGADTFEIQISSEGCIGGIIDVRLDSVNGNSIGSFPVYAGHPKWTYLSCPITNNFNGKHTVYLVFKRHQAGTQNFFKLNWFTFKHSKAAPFGHQVAFKSLNPNCTEYNNTGNQGQMYLCVDSNYNYDLCANRSAVAGGWEKFNLTDALAIVGHLENTIKILSSNNGLTLIGNGNTAPIKARIIMDRDPFYADSFYWMANTDGTISLKNRYSNKYVCVDTWGGKPNNPAKAYDNRDINDFAEKFYCEAGDAPIGYVVAFKSQNPDCYDNNGGNIGQKYLCADTNLGGILCANRNAVGQDNYGVSWEKFLVVDANNGYVALKSQKTNQFIRFSNELDPGTAYGGTSLNTQDNSVRFQWQNNGDGTVSLINVGVGKYLCVDTVNNANNPAKCYANRNAVDYDVDKLPAKISWEKFYCQITQ